MTASADTKYGNERPKKSARVRKGEPAVMAALAAGATIDAAAKAGGVSERTVRRRLHETDYRSQIHGLRRESLVRASRIISVGAEAAANVLIGLLMSENDNIKLRAAATLLDRQPLPELADPFGLTPEEIIARGQAQIDYLNKASRQRRTTPG